MTQQTVVEMLEACVKEWRRRADAYAVAEMSGVVLSCARELEEVIAAARAEPSASDLVRAVREYTSPEMSHALGNRMSGCYRTMVEALEQYDARVLAAQRNQKG